MSDPVAQCLLAVMAVH